MLIFCRLSFGGGGGGLRNLEMHPRDSVRVLITCEKSTVLMMLLILAHDFYKVLFLKGYTVFAYKVGPKTSKKPVISRIPELHL